MKIIAIGASAGGIQAFRELFHQLDSHLPAAIFVVLHVPRKETSILPRILAKAGRLPASHAVDGESIREGHIYVAPPDHHLLIGRQGLRLTRGPKENLQRPAVDPMFRTAARSHGPNVIGIVLSGAGSDGATGLSMIQAAGGLAIVQAPEDSVHPSMPEKAIAATKVDWALSARQIGVLLNKLANEPTVDFSGAEDMTDEADPEESEKAFRDGEVQSSAPSQFSRPECHGVLREVDDRQILRYRCRVGHSYTAESLLDDQSAAVETALWASLRALEERASMLDRMTERLGDRGLTHSAEHFTKEANEARENASVLSRLLHNELLFRPTGEESIEAETGIVEE